jgi:hypothetical protein
MAKATSKGGKKPASGGKFSMRDAQTGQFRIGRTAFSSISSVEGITLSRDMQKDFARTDGMAAEKRRSEFASKYGKK